MKLEEYIAKRKKEDGINEFDLQKTADNTRICVNYIFEYFNNYLESRGADNETILHMDKLDKYRQKLNEYDPEIQDWLVNLYSSYGNYINRQMKKFLTNDYYLLYDSDAEFRALSYEVYPKIIKKFKYLEGHSEMIFRFIKDEHRVRSMFHDYDDFYISEKINEWIINTYNKYGVNIYKFCEAWVEYFYENPDIWPKGHKRKSQYYDKYRNSKNLNFNDSMLWDYDYKQKSNLFGLNSLYQKMPKKPFIRGKKQELEIIMMYCWLHIIESDAEYWYEYIQKVISE